MYTETRDGSHIWEVKNEEGYEDGWYFSDETEQLNGPFTSRGEAEKQLRDYCDELDTHAKH